MEQRLKHTIKIQINNSALFSDAAITFNFRITQNQNIHLLFELSILLRLNGPQRGTDSYPKLNPRHNDAIAIRHKIKRPPLSWEIMRQWVIFPTEVVRGSVGS